MVDALVSGTSVSNDVQVRVLFWAHYSNSIFAEIAQLVEHNLAKVGVASSSLVFRSNLKSRVYLNSII